MHPFPFTVSEWNEVSETARLVVEASEADDGRLREIHLERLMLLLAALRSTYGDHPVLLETLADFTPNPGRRAALYRHALHLAAGQGMLTSTIRLSLADVLLIDLGDAAEAERQLAACCDEVDLFGDDPQREHWFDLDQRCQQSLGAQQTA